MVKIALEFQTHNWLVEVERQRMKIIDELAAQISREHPEIFSDQLVGESYTAAETVVKNYVLTRKDLAPSEVEGVVKAIMGQATSYGPLQEFFVGREAEEITEVMVNPSKDGPRVFYGKHGKLHDAGRGYFKDNEEVTRYCQKICEDVGRPFTEDAPIVDAWLKDGSRVAVMGFKVSPLGTALTIRKSPLLRPPMPLEKLVEYEMLPSLAASMMVDLLVKGHANIGIFGRTDSGKTTFARSLAQHINPRERIFIAETSLEMYLPNLPNCINLVELVYGDRTIVDMTQLCKTMNRNNPDRSIVGEIRSKEIIAASQIASSTSGGFWTTGHAGDVNDLRTRLFGMFLDGGVQLPVEFLDEIIRSMFYFLVFLDKSFDGRRTLMALVEVTNEGYRTIIRYDTEAFAASRGKERRWIYENPVTPERLGKLAFSGAELKPEYEKVSEKYLG
ncbi:CpaF/VirB11 family protein [Moorella naiadis]|uniref:ATPase, T2SS/T4P/T4SS family n=1 Tax=Moorella naiadis (nom. illeg.) TaxID=3093670 RepID=UPI003D9C8A70